MVKLKRALGLFEATFYGIGIILGAGIYALVGQATALSGNAVWLAFVVGAFVASFTGLSYAELSSMYPKAAAEFVYVRKAYQSKFWAFLIGWLLIFTGIVSVSTVSLGFAGYFNVLFNIPILISALGIISLLSFVNYLGIQESSRLNILFTIITISGLLLIIFLGAGSLGNVNYLEMPFGFQGVMAAAALIFFAYLGFEDIVNISEETRSPKKLIPLALVIAIMITTLIYIFTSLSVVSLANWKEVGVSDAPLAFVASKSFLGEGAFQLLSTIALFATGSTILVMISVTARMMYGMAKERTLPGKLSILDRRRNTPWVAIIAIMLFSQIFTFIGDIGFIAEITSLGALLAFAAVNSAVVWLRVTKPNLKRPFKVPFNIGRYPVIPILGILTSTLLILQFENTLLTLTVAVLVIGTGMFEAKRRKLI